MSCFWKRREWKSTFCKTHREKKEQQMSNSAAVIAQFCAELWSSVTFQGVEHQLHGIYMISCIFTPIVWYCSQEREFHNGRRLRRIPAGNEVVHGHLRVVQPVVEILWKLWSFSTASVPAAPRPHPEHLLGLRFHIFVSCEISCCHSCGKATTPWAVCSGKHAQSPPADRGRGEGKGRCLQLFDSQALRGACL